MALVIRLTTVGRKGERRFRVVVKEKRSKRDGKAIDTLGWYQKNVGGIKKEINKDRYNYWVSQGAKPSLIVAKLIE